MPDSAPESSGSAPDLQAQVPDDSFPAGGRITIFSTRIFALAVAMVSSVLGFVDGRTTLLSRLILNLKSMNRMSKKLIQTSDGGLTYGNVKILP